MGFPSLQYPSINPTVLKTILARMFHRSFSLSKDSKRLCAKARPLLIYSGLENIPASRPLLITANHFHRPGFNTAWIALSISAAFDQEVHWIMSNEWLFEGNPFAFVLRPVMRFILKSITLAYGFLPMPTMVNGYSTSQARTTGVRAVIEFLRHHPDVILGLTPEGLDSLAENELRLPPPGAGRFIFHLQQMGV
jgi:1-acyl-sn-glycerol-3-phosphate acyltransferase